MQRGKAGIAAALLAIALLVAGCAAPGQSSDGAEPENLIQEEATPNEVEDEMDVAEVTAGLRLLIDGEPVEVIWEDNESVAALRELVADTPLEVRMTPYGGFEQYGPLGADLPRDDVEITTAPGDVVLYTGNQIVVFSGSNSWAYTRLGKIVDKDPDELASLLGNGPITLTIEVVA